jgi:hypothetical protein
MVLAMGMLMVTVRARIAAANGELAQKKAELGQKSSIIAEFNRLNEQKAELEEKVLAIKDILKDRIIWSERLNQLASLTPDNVWYKRLRVISQSFKEQQPKLDPKTNQPVLDPKTQKVTYETITTQKPVLEVSGYVVADEQGERRINPLIDKTSDPNAQFAQDFTLLQPKMEDTEFKGFAVRGFTLEYLIESKKSVDTPAKSAPAGGKS